MLLASLAIAESLHGTTSVQLEPNWFAAVTSSFVVALIFPFDNSAITIVSDIFSPQITFASSLSS